MTAVSALHALARLHHVQTAYTDIAGRRRRASPEALVHVLRALGAPLASVDEAPDALRRRQADLAGELLPPVIVVRGARGAATVRPGGRQTIAMELIREDGTAQRWTMRGEPGRPLTVSLPALPFGYHTLRAVQGKMSTAALVLAAPGRAFGGSPAKTWGVFLPLYALRATGTWGAGTFSDLAEFAAWITGLGGSVVATLPLLPVFLDMPFDPSPYAPVSRRFWNEFYVDVQRVPDLAAVPAARRLIASEDFQRELRRQRRAPFVEYAPQMRQKRAVLELLARALVQGAPGPRREEFEEFVRSRPDTADYAAFRAAMERQSRSWTQWPARLRDGTLRREDFDEDSRQYHLYTQWIAHEQFTAASGAARQAGGIVYLDLPLGVHPWGYDAWRDRDIFAAGVSAGAPPDTFFAQGQNWGTRPLHPDCLRASGYQYVIACLRHHLAHATLLRIDHVMGLHRFFWIPDGFPAADGVYVRYPADEFYAILTLESMRHRAMIVGENLGTVPRSFTQAMQRHGILQTYVVQYALQPDTATPLAPAPPDSVASLNTHDMPPFAAWWTGRELRDLRALGHLSAAHASTEWQRRRAMLRALIRSLQRQRLLRLPATARRMLHALLAHLAGGPARIVLVNLEDLWLETNPQNVPGTAEQRPNWRRKAAFTVAHLRRMDSITRLLRNLDRRRRSV